MADRPRRVADLSPDRLRELMDRLREKGRTGAAAAPVERRPRPDGLLPLSFSQERLWFLEQLEPGAATYNLPAPVRLAGVLDSAALEQALAAAVRRHEALRTTFSQQGGQPFQVIAPPADMALPRLDLSAVPGPSRETELARIAGEQARQPFDLERGPLLRAVLARLGDEDHALLLTMHHIVSDGWSLGILVREIAALYEAFAAGRPSPLPELPVQPADHALWQREHLQGETLAAHLAFWRERLAGAPPLDLPTDAPRPPMQTFRGAQEELVLPPGTAARLEALARRDGATLFMALLALFQALLGRYTGQTDLVVGAPVANRNRRELEGLIGFFANTLALRVNLAGSPGFRELLGRVREVMLEATAHEDLPFERLVAELQPERDRSRPPLAQALCGLQSRPELRMGGLRLAPIDVETGTARVDLTLLWNEEPGRLRGVLEHNTALFGRASARRLLRHLEALLQGVLEDAERPLWELPLLSPEERRQLLADGSGAWTAYPRDATIPELFAAQARRTPAALAVDFAGDRLTYAELQRRAHRLAWYLLRLGRLGVTPGDRVGLALERSADLVVGMLGILAAGGAYVPLDPSYPPERRALMSEDAGLAVVVTPAELASSAMEREDAPPVRVPAGSPAYVMYTSGSTGRPKGVVIPHRAIARLVLEADYIRLEPSDRVAQVSNASFDAVTFEVWGPLLTGGCVLGLSRDATLAPELLARELADRGITVLFLTTALFNQVARQVPGAFRGLRHLLAGGEAVDPGLMRAVLADGPGRLIHVYGPTESTTFATWHLVREVPPGAATVPIGRALARTSVWVVDPVLGFAPAGLPGELLIGGDGLALGYWRRPDLTAERFVPHPWSGAPGERLYRTGDLARWRDGALEFLGRIDQQVKIRGFRIEPGEAEAALLEHPAVTACAVVPRQDAPGDRRLAAYLVALEGTAPAPAELRAFLAGRLPAYMVPAAFVALPALPLNPNGKVDRRALLRLPPPGEADLAGSAGEPVAPRTPVERQIAEAWAELLGLERLGVHDDFFALGGHSLLATQAVSRLRDRFGVEIPLRDLFEEPTVAAMAARVESALGLAGAPEDASLVAVSRHEAMPLSYAQERLWFLEQLEPGTAFYNVPAACRLVGPLRVEVLRLCLAELVRRHEALRTTFQDRDGRPVQVIAGTATAGMPMIDLSALPPAHRDPALLRLATEESQRPFDLERGPLLRAPLVRLSATEHCLVPTLHHIISDGWSITVAIREMAALYEAFAAGRPSSLPAPRLQYADYAVWQRRHLQGEAFAARLAWWCERLSGVSGLALPADRPRPAVETFRGRQRPVALSPELTASLHDFARREQVTLFMVLLAAFQTLLGRASGQTDLAVGSPIANRNRSETEGAIGFFSNTVVLRTDLGGDPSFRELLGRVREVTLGAYAHEDVPFEKVVEALQPERDMSRNPLFQVMCVLQNQPWPALRIGDLEIRQLPIDTGTAKFDLTLFWREEDGRLTGLVEHNTDLFDDTTARRMYLRYEALLRAALEEPGGRIGAMPLLDAPERHQVLLEWSSGGSTGWAGRCVHAWVEEQMARTPGAVAVIDGERSLTYAALDARANRLARGLRRHGVGPEALVGICVERSLEMVVAALAVAKAGGALVALDPAYPRERLAAIIDDARLAVLLTQAPLLENFPQHAHIALLYERGAGLFPEESAERPESGVDPDNPIYAIYTSGSTGQPKGILVTHRAFSNLLAWQLADSGLRVGARTVALSTFGFCVSFQEMFSSWCAGGTLVVADEMTRRDLTGLGTFLEEHGIERLHLPFAALKGLAEAAAMEDRLPSRLAEVITAGEQLQVTPAVRALFARLPGCALSNQYGASETHVISALTLAGPPDGWPAIPPVGRPVTNVRIHLLDGGLQPVPIGVAGELYAGGVCTARCYLNDPVLTAQKLVPDPYSPEPGARLYRTGDAARHLADGRIEYHGRIDTQVKIRGFRVELGEIDTVLARHPAVRDAAVMAKPGGDGGQRLVAYVVPAGPEAMEADELRSWLRQKLPEHMVPAAFVEMPALPVNANGKLDQAALPEPGFQAGSRDYVAPRTPAEERVAAVWSQVLGIERVGVHDNFFAIGGHSLLATRVAARLRQALGVDVSVRTLFEEPTVAELAAALAGRLREPAGGDGAVPAAIPRRPRDGRPLPLTFSQERLWFLDRLQPGSPVYNLPAGVELTGELHPAALAAALAGVVRRHESLRTTFGESDGQPFQRIAPELDLPLPQIDLAALPEEARREEAGRQASGQAAWRFDLARGPLIAAALLRLGPGRHRFLLTLHHVIADGWSSGILIRELAALYAAAVAGRPSPLPELPLQVPDVAVWQRETATAAQDSEIAWWLERLRGEIAPLDLPADRPRPAVQRARGGWVRRTVAPGLADRLRSFGQREGATLFMTLLAGVQTLLHRLSGQDDVVVGSPIAGRRRAEVEGLIGCFLNTLALRTDLSGNPGFRQLLARVREVTLGAYAHQDVPFEALLARLQPERDLSRTPLFQVMLNLLNYPVGELRAPGLELRLLSFPDLPSKLDMTFYVEDRGDRGLGIELAYDADLFAAARMEELLDQLELLFAGALAEPERPMGELSLQTPRARAVLPDLDEPLPAAWEGAVWERLSAHTLQDPGRPAAADAGGVWTRAELDATAGRVRDTLRRAGIGAEAPVAVWAHRSAPLAAALLGAWKAGAAVLLLDPAYPPAHLAGRLRAVPPRGWIEVAGAGPVPRELEEALAAARPACRLRLPAAPLAGEAPVGTDAASAPDGLAYIAFTSGSTGEPKAIAGTHRPLSHFLAWHARRFRLGPEDRFSALSGLSHDPLLRDLLTPLWTGGLLCLPAAEAFDTAGGLAAWMRRERVTVAHLTPALAQLLWEDEGSLPALRLAFFGGDRLTAHEVRGLRRTAPGAAAVSYYGATETPQGMGWTEVADEGEGEAVPLGRGIPGVQLLVLPPAGLPAGIGELGEVCVRTPYLARGYLGAAATAERFVPDSSAGETGGRLYRTGDLGRYLPDGQVAFAGRADRQVKLRGFRIEPAEVEAALASRPGVRDAAVILGGHRGELCLVAFAVPAAPGSATAASLRAALGERLPSHKVPAAIALLERLPLTPNGKLDRRALARLTPDPGRDAGGDEPRTPVEEALAGIWAGLLGVEKPGIRRSFFELGGHSLLATRLLTRVRDVFGADLSLRAVFESPTIAGLAARIEAARADGALPLAPAITRAATRPDEVPLSFAQERFWLLEQLQPGAYNIPFAVRLRGLLDPAALAAACAEVVRRHEVLRTVFPRRAGRPVQAVLSAAAFPLPLADLAALPPGDREAEALRLARDAVRRPFDLERGPLLRALLVRLGEGEHTAALAIHHTVFDAWSAAVLVDELAALYAAARAGRPSPLPELPIQAADYALWQRAWLRGEALEAHRAFWRGALAGAPPGIALPADRAPAGPRTDAAVEARSSLAPAAVRALREEARSCGATLFMALLAGLDLLLWQWTGETDLVVGTVLAERDRPPAERLIGCFLNFLPLRVRLAGRESFREILVRVRDAALAAHDHRDLPFEEIAAAAGVRGSGRNRLYNVALLLQNVPRPRSFGEGLTAHLLPLPAESALLDLRLIAEETEDGALALRWEASAGLFEPATVERLAAAWERALAHLTAEPGEPAAGLLAAALPEGTARSLPRQVAVAATFTAEPVERSLRFWLDELELPAGVAFAPYGQLFQELLDPDGLFARNRGGVNVGLVRLEDWRDGIERAADDLARAVRTAAARGGSPLLLCLCPPSPRALADPGAAGARRHAEAQLAAGLAGVPGVHLTTAGELEDLYPVAEPHDPHADELGHVPYTPAFFTALGTLVARRVWRLLTPPHKVIAVDCDQTLWKGICGEDGPMGLEIDPPRRALQELLVAQRAAGMLLCLCSKNHAADVEAVFRLRDDMPLRREHITAWRLDWQPKSRSLRSLAAELGLGLDSFIFLDDNPVEHAEVEAECPEVLSLLLPSEPGQLPGFLRHVWAFDHLEVTEEDRRRAAVYGQSRERERLREALSLEEFLAELELEVEVGPMAPAHLARVAQLTQRTNQFNLTTLRRTEPELAALLASGAREGRVVHVRDRFGDYGLVGAVVFTVGPHALEVEIFLMSCRVLGRRAEHRVVAALGELALARGLERVDLRFAPSERNRPAADFLEEIAGERPLRHSEDDGWVFRLPAARAAALGTLAREEAGLV